MSVPPPRPSAPVCPGDVLASKYRVEQVLGVGGMGVVVAAMHLELEERVAVKFLLPEIAENSNAAARFVREARAAARIKSEYVARVIDVGRLESGAPYMVMEYLEGLDLAELVRTGPLSIEDTADYVIQACHAMAEAHAAGIVHRDLKPANLFLAQRPDGTRVVKVLDFGISKSGVDPGEAALTKTSTMMGSPYYMSPEQMRSARDVDQRTDIWSLGVILFELLAGRPPFQGDSLPELLTSIMTDAPPSLSSLRPEVPAALEQLVMRCLQKSRDARIADVGELTRALLPFGSRRSRYTAERILKLTGALEGLPTSLPPAQAVALHQTVGVGDQTATNWAETHGQTAAKNTRRLLAWGGGGFVLIALAASAALVLESPQPASSVASGAPSAPAVSAALPGVPAPHVETPVGVEVPPAPLVTPAKSAAAVQAAPVTPTKHVNAVAPKRSAKPAAPKPASPEPAAPAPAKRNPLSIELK